MGEELGANMQSRMNNSSLETDHQMKTVMERYVHGRVSFGATCLQCGEAAPFPLTPPIIQVALPIYVTRRPRRQ